MSSLLIPDTPLQVLPKLACLVGLHEAIVLQQIHYLSLRGDGWVQKTLDEWCAVFSFLSRRAVQRAFSSLRGHRLLMTETAGIGGRRTRVRVDHDVLDELADLAVQSTEAMRQSGAFNAPNWRDQSARLAHSTCQIGAKPRVMEGELKAEELQNDATHRRASPSGSDDILVVFQAWQIATGRTDDAVLDDKRRSIIRAALKTHGPVDCLDAVRGWRHSPYHCGRNRDQIALNSIGLLLGSAETLERCRDLERHRGNSAQLLTAPDHVAAPSCPGHQAGPALSAIWTPIAQELAELVPASVHDIWLASLHPHADLDGTLIVGLRPEVATFVGDRFRKVLDAAAAGVQVTLVECELDTRSATGPTRHGGSS